MATRAELRGHGGSHRYEDVEEDVEENVVEDGLDGDDELLMMTPSKDHLNDEDVDGEEGQQYDDEEGLDGENLSQNELNILQQLEEQEAEDNEYGEDLEENATNGRIYQNKLCKPVLAIGKTKVGMSQAKLFGLMGHDGKLNLTSTGPSVDRTSQQKNFLNMSKPREIDPDLIEAKGETPSFKPSRTKEALNAMKNPKCGYDFVNRMKDDKTDFLERVSRDTNKKGSYTKAELDTMEADYAIRQDKLQCPQCKKPQSFDEFIEKKRNCSQCNKKFDKLNVTSGMNFARKAQEKEAERRAKLREKEVAMYGEKCETFALPRTKPKVTPPLPPPDKNASNSKFIKENILRIAQQSKKKSDSILPPIGDEGAYEDEGNGIAYSSKAKKTNKLSMDGNKLIINKEQSGLPWINMVEKIAIHNNNNAELLNATLINLQQQYGAHVEDDTDVRHSRPPKGAPAKNNRPKSANGSTKNSKGNASPKDKTTMKFEKLLDVDDTMYE